MKDVFDNEPYSKFKYSLDYPIRKWSGVSPKAWFEYVRIRINEKDLNEPCNVSDRKLSRNDLYKACIDTSVSDLELVIMVLAWGGMRRTNGVFAISGWKNWCPIIRRLRAGNLSRSDGYKGFWNLNPTGMGPAFYTKLIFFCSPSHDGFIMDQWTGRSANLILGQNLVKLSPQNSTDTTKYLYVSKKNTFQTYEKFCEFIERVARETHRDPRIIEEHLFSNGGQKKGIWRGYVVNNT
jgi:hypothetical protein